MNYTAGNSCPRRNRLLGHNKSRGSPSKQVADVAGTGRETKERRETKEKNSIIRYELAEGAAGRKAANNDDGGIEQMLHVGGGRCEGGQAVKSLNAAT